MIAEKVIADLRAKSKSCTAYEHADYKHSGVKALPAPKEGDEAVSFNLTSSIEGTEVPMTFTIVRSESTLAAFCAMNLDADKVRVPAEVIEAQLAKLTKLMKLTSRRRCRAEPKRNTARSIGSVCRGPDGEEPRGVRPAGLFGVSTGVRAAPVLGERRRGVAPLYWFSVCRPPGGALAHWGSARGLDLWQSDCAVRLSGVGCPCIVLDGARPPQPFRPPLNRFRRSAPGVPEADRSLG
ncbi:hypothetical protein [Streptomyces acidicola]|uniref:hypothetical protein n=1 Tax=Streptomyces acidicola TaxID=2596892 RepID=UPI00381AFDAF